jgi:hypothetical protein
VSVSEPPRGKQVKATDLLGGMRSVPNATVQRGPVVRSVPEAVVEVDPEPTPRRRLKPTALKLPATITDELRSAMIWLRANGEWARRCRRLLRRGSGRSWIGSRSTMG